MNAGALRWLLQRVTGIALLIFLLTHFIITHYYPVGEITFAKVAARLSQPDWKFFNLAFLILCLYHGVNGGWSILEDYLKKGWFRLTLFGIMLIVALSLLIWGTLTIFDFRVK
jgi:succinate dehydrogenase / fumarate reductase, membrane anchor subunit